MRVTNVHVLMRACALLVGLSPFDGWTEANPADDWAAKLWDTDRKLAVFLVEASGADGFAKGIGTAFMVSEQYAVTAGHVVCRGGQSEPLPNIVLYEDGNRARDFAPDHVICKPDNIDAAIIKVHATGTGRKFLKAGTWNSLKADPFVTLYGYGGGPVARRLFGSSQIVVDPSNQLLSTLPAYHGDSGAPVLDRSGRAIGILSVGNELTTGIVPLQLLTPYFQRFNIGFDIIGDLPAAVKLETGTTPARREAAIKGSVKIFPGLVNGQWPVPSSKPAGQGEATVTASLVRSGDTTSFLTDTDETGAWSIPLEEPIKDPIEFSGIVVQRGDQGRDAKEYEYWADPVYTTVSPDSLGRPVLMELFERSMYVGRKFGSANGQVKILTGRKSWRDCSSDYINGTPSVGCSADERQEVHQRIAQIDGDFTAALEASLASSRDVGTSTRIVAAWSAFRLFSGRPCEAVSAMLSLFQSYSTDTLSPLVLSQTLNMISQCLAYNGGKVASPMPWRQQDESRQTAAVRLMLELLERFASPPELAHSIRGTVVRELATAFERYQPGTVLVVKAAQEIAETPKLYDLFSQYVTLYPGALCSMPMKAPLQDPDSVRKSLDELRSLATTCK